MKGTDIEKVINAILLLTASTCEVRKTPNSPCYGKAFSLKNVLNALRKYGKRQKENEKM